MKQTARWLVVGLILLSTIVVISVASKPAEKDYISYWSAGQLLAHHQDPYSGSQVLAIEKTQGYQPSKPIIMRNPPWALFLTMPLALGSPRAGLIFWMAATIGCILVCFRLLQMPPQDRILAFCFAPVLGCLASGQSSPFLLLGFSLFLYFHRSKPLIAGAALLFMAIKPHLFLVFWVVLLVDCIYRRRFRLVAGLVLALIAATALAMRVDPLVWPQYLAMLRSAVLSNEFLQTPAYILRYLIAPRVEWVQLVPSLAATAWGIWFYARNRANWDWRTHGMPVMLVALVTSPYGWMTDEIVLLPAVMLTLSNPKKSKYSTALFMVISGTVMAMLIAGLQLSSGAYLWTASAWFAWYLYSRPSTPNPSFDRHEEVDTAAKAWS